MPGKWLFESSVRQNVNVWNKFSCGAQSCSTNCFFYVPVLAFLGTKGKGRSANDKIFQWFLLHLKKKHLPPEWRVYPSVIFLQSGKLDKTRKPTPCYTSAVHFPFVTVTLFFDAGPLCQTLPPGHVKILLSMSRLEWDGETEDGQRTFTLNNLSSKRLYLINARGGLHLLVSLLLQEEIFRQSLIFFFCLGLFCCSGVRKCKISLRVHSCSWCSFWMHVILIGVHIIPAPLYVWSVLQYCCAAVITHPVNLRGRWRVMNHKLISAAPLRSPNSSTRC